MDSSVPDSVEPAEFGQLRWIRASLDGCCPQPGARQRALEHRTRHPQRPRQPSRQGADGGVPGCAGEGWIMSLNHLFTNKNQRVAVVAGVIMHASDRGSGCPACGYEGFGTQWNKCLALAESIVNDLDAVEPPKSTPDNPPNKHARQLTSPP